MKICTLSILVSISWTRCISYDTICDLLICCSRISTNCYYSARIYRYNISISRNMRMIRIWNSHTSFKTPCISKCYFTNIGTRSSCCKCLWSCFNILWWNIYNTSCTRNRSFYSCTISQPICTSEFFSWVKCKFA